MFLPSRLLTTSVSLANWVCRHMKKRELQIIHMKDKSTRHLFLRKLAKSKSLPEAIYSTYVNLLESKASRGVNRKFKRIIMEPFLDMCYQPNDSSNCTTMTENKTDSMITNNIQDLIVDVNMAHKHQPGMSMRRYKEIRQWKAMDKAPTKINSDTDFILRILSFNILAQNLLETHSYLYKEHNNDALEWERRKLLIQQEILEANANVICLQEMQEEHLGDFLIPFLENGYKYLYKKRTNDTKDGLLLLYRSNQFQLEDYVFVEFRQTSSDILNRDNVGIVVKFSLKEQPDAYVVISTTHLLYNPKRNDVRLAQTQVLFAELERIAFIENTTNGPKYHPIIVCGDFNLQPFTGVHDFIINGSFDYCGKTRTLNKSGSLFRLDNTLIPTSLLITDNCQHFNVLSKRLRGFGSNKVMLNRTDSAHKQSKEVFYDDKFDAIEVDTYSTDCQKIEIIDGHYANFSSGLLTHPFKLKSVYQHVNSKGEMEATTHQGEWITVDYIFYSDVEPISQYTLPTASECTSLPTIPNFVVGSDHLCLGASFKLKK